MHPDQIREGVDFLFDLAEPHPGGFIPADEVGKARADMPGRTVAVGLDGAGPRHIDNVQSEGPHSLGMRPARDSAVKTN